MVSAWQIKWMFESSIRWKMPKKMNFLCLGEQNDLLAKRMSLNYRTSTTKYEVLQRHEIHLLNTQIIVLNFSDAMRSEITISHYLFYWNEMLWTSKWLKVIPLNLPLWNFPKEEAIKSVLKLFELFFTDFNVKFKFKFENN